LLEDTGFLATGNLSPQISVALGRNLLRAQDILSLVIANFSNNLGLWKGLWQLRGITRSDFVVFVDHRAPHFYVILSAQLPSNYVEIARASGWSTLLGKLLLVFVVIIVIVVIVVVVVT
jgi:hypothetical protein